MAHLGSATCELVGWTDCPAGFALDSSGWGCDAILPEEACTGATREALGASDCQPIGDCAAPFPPVGATLFVDDDYSAAQLDATHFASLQPALDAARSGAVIAVEAGTYCASIYIDHGVTVVGRCAEQVSIVNDTSLYPGVEVLSQDEVHIRNVSIRGYESGLSVNSGGRLVLEDSLLADNIIEGLVVYGDGHVIVRQSVVRGTVNKTPSDQTLGVFVFGGGVLEMYDSSVVANVEAGVGIIDAGSALLFDGVIIRDTRPKDEAGGLGLKAFDGAAVQLRRTAFKGNRIISLMLDGVGVEATVEQTVVRETVLDPRTEGGQAWGVAARNGARLTLNDSAIWDTPSVALSVQADPSSVVATRVVIGRVGSAGPIGVGMAVTVEMGGQLEMTDSALFASTGVAVLVNNAASHAAIIHSVISDSMPLQGALRTGECGYALIAAAGGGAVISESTFQRNAEVTLAVVNAGSSLAVFGALIDDTQANALGSFGDGLMVGADASAVVDRTLVRRSRRIGVVDDGASILVTRSRIESNAIGIHVQNGSTLREAATARA